MPAWTPAWQAGGLLYLFDDDGGSADADHQHAVILAEDFVVEVDADDGAA